MQRTKEHFPFLDYLRGLAILMVFLFHCLGIGFGHDQLAWGRYGLRNFAEPGTFLALLPVTLGWAGVAFFFVISGFCIHLSFLKGASSDWHGFFMRRWFRIYPPYLFALLFFAFVFPVTRLSFHTRLDLTQMGSHLLLLHNFDKRFFFGINPAFWSIAVEAQLYLIYPVLIALTGRFGWRRTLLLVGGLEVALRGAAGAVSSTAIGGEAPQWLIGCPFFSWFSWAIGAAIADAFVHKRPLPFRSASAAAWLFLAVCTYAVKPLYYFSFLFFAVLTATIIAKRLGRDIPSAIAPSPFPLSVHLRSLGGWSYSFYLLHQPIVMAVPFILHRIGIIKPPPLIIFLACVSTYPFIALASWLYFTYCERHNIALGKLSSRSKMR